MSNCLELEVELCGIDRHGFKVELFLGPRHPILPMRDINIINHTFLTSFSHTFR
jgi:hypothetical protein